MRNALAEQVRSLLRHCTRDIFRLPRTCPARPTQSKIFIQGGPGEENRIKMKDLSIIIMYRNASLKAIVFWIGYEELIIMSFHNFHFVIV